MRKFKNIKAFCDAQGTEIGVSDWFRIDQDRINRFAGATDDHQWIHVDPARTRAELDMDTIAHGFLTLSLIPKFKYEIFTIESAKRIINYGTNKIRFLNTVPVDAMVRCRLFLKRASLSESSVRSIADVTIEIKGGSRPALVAETITLFYE